MTRSLHRPIIILTLLLAGILFVVSQAFADGVETIFITDEIDVGAFPNVSLTFRAVDSNNAVPDILTNDDIVVYENGQPVADFEVGPPVNDPVFVIFVVDLGKWANFRGEMAKTVRDSMIQFTDGYFRDSIDTVAILAQTADTEAQNTITLLEPTQSSARFTNAVNALNLTPDSPEQTQGLLGVEAALNRLAELSQPGYAGTAVIYISKLIELPQQSVAERDARTLAAVSSEQFAQLYSFHTENEYGEPLQALAAGSGGEYIQLLTDRDNSGNLNRVYHSIIAQGARYSLNYRSQSDDSGPRTVIVAPSGTPVELAINVQSYNVSLQPAAVKIQGPEDNATFTRKATRAGENTWNYDRDSIAVTAELISWPDGFERDIKSVNFFADGVALHTVENPAGDTFNFNLDISKIEEPETLTLHVQVRDELGIEAESDSISVNIAVKRDEEITVVVLPTPTPAPPIVINEDPCVQNPASVACVLKYAPWGIVLILSVVMLIYRQKVVSIAGVVGGAALERVAEVRKTILGGGSVRGKKVLAKLHVIVARRDLEGEEVKIHTDRTTIGRNPKLCDVLLYDEDEVSSVSGQHCTIQYDGGAFLITDDNSANGTLVNGDLLPPNSPRELQQGDEIILGDLFHRGAKLRFEIVDSQPGGKQTVEGNVTLLDSDFTEPTPSFEGSETILDMADEGQADEGHGTLFEELDGYDDSASSEKEDTDWLSDLE